MSSSINVEARQEIVDHVNTVFGQLSMIRRLLEDLSGLEDHVIENLFDDIYNELSEIQKIGTGEYYHDVLLAAPRYAFAIFNEINEANTRHVAHQMTQEAIDDDEQKQKTS